jgi:hypothetical protein
MGLQRLTGVGISNIYYEENGNIRLTYYIDGDAMSGAGKVNITIERDNIPVAKGDVEASMPLGRTYITTTVPLSSRVPGSTHNIKITGTKNGVVRTASKSNTFPVQADLDKIDINFTHRETIPEKILTDTFSFINIGNFGGVRFAIDEDVTDSSTKYETNSIQTIANNDNKKHVINYRYKCGDLVTTKSYTVDHSTSEPEHRVPYVYPNPVLTQVDNNHYEISIHDFTNDGSAYGVTDTSKIKVRVIYNNKYIDFDYANFTENKLKVELNYSTKITCFVYNTEYDTDKSENVILNFVYKLPEIKMITPDISWTANRRPNGEIVKTGVYINTKFTEIINLNSVEFPNINKPDGDGTLYTIYTIDGSIPNINNTEAKLTENTNLSIGKNCIAYFRNVFIYKDKKRNPTYSDSVRFVYNVRGEGNPFYFDYKKPSLKYPSNIYSYLDVIYNNDYNNSKSLESINYILNYFDNRYSLDAKNIYNVAEDGLRRRYAGYYLDVYTDETQAINLKLSDGSNDTDENNKDAFNHYDDYKFAKFDKGSWNFNYFRNGFNGSNNELSKDELARACNYIYYNPSTKQNEVHTITEEDLKKSPLYKSDNRSLIYGKYIVARFIFNNDDATHRFKLENITFNTQQY